MPAIALRCWKCVYCVVYGGKPIVPDEIYDGGFYILNLSKSAAHWEELTVDMLSK